MHGLGLVWVLEPTHAKLFFGFLVIVCLITVVRTVALALALFRLPGRPRVTLADVTAWRRFYATAMEAAMVRHTPPS